MNRPAPVEFGQAIALFQSVAGGAVQVHDYAISHTYRMGSLRVLVPFEDAPARAAELIEVAIAVGGHVSIATHYTTTDGRPACAIEVFVSRELPPEEPREQRREVAIADALADTAVCS